MSHESGLNFNKNNAQLNTLAVRSPTWIDVLAGYDMAEKLTKHALKSELTRRIDWFEEKYGFDPEFNSASDMEEKGHSLVIAYGRYLSLIEMRWQIQNNLFIDGYTLLTST